MSGTAIPVDYSNSYPAVDSPIPRLSSSAGLEDVDTAGPAGPAATSPLRRRPFTSRVEAVNRALLVLLGLVCLGGGVVVLLAGRGVFGTDVSNRPTLTPGNRAFAAGHAWFWPIVGLATAVVVLLALAWLLAQLSRGQLSWLYVVDDTFGRVRVDSRAFSAAVENDLAGTSGVRDVRARVLGKEKHPVLRIVVTMEPDLETDIGRVRFGVEQVALPHARTALARQDLTAEIQLVPGTGPVTRVH